MDANAPLHTVAPPTGAATREFVPSATPTGLTEPRAI